MQHAETEAGGLQVIVDLLSMLVIQGRDGLDLHDDLVETNEVRLVGLLQGAPLYDNCNSDWGTNGIA